jgi:large subunit ribosomal protein L10
MKRKVPEYKLKLVNELKKLLKENSTLLIASIKSLPGSQFQEICKKMRGKAIVKVPKKNLIFRALDGADGEEIEKLKKKIDRDFALLFSNNYAFDLAADLLKNKSPAKAKAGQKAPKDIIVQAGPTDLVPGPAISELGAVGIQIQIKDGKIEIKEDKVIVKEGQVISQAAADIMSKLDIKPFSIGFIPVAAFDAKEQKFYSNINIDSEKAIADLKEAFGRALPFAVSIGYISDDTIKFLLSKANAQAMKINRIMTGEPDPEVAPVAEAAPTETPKEETKEEPKKEAAAEGLGALFG